ncbi:hypothetical protein GCM10010398_61980 [Streptomyces fimbriatus]
MYRVASALRNTAAPGSPAVSQPPPPAPSSTGDMAWDLERSLIAATLEEVPHASGYGGSAETVSNLSLTQ